MKLKALIVGCSLVSYTRAAAFEINWFTIDSGGGRSSNLTYVVDGTIGQTDAGTTMSGGGYAVAGGFWPAVDAVQVPGAPLLTLVRTGGNIALSWTPATPGFVLQQSPALAPKEWQNAPSGATNPIVIPANAAERYYRLRKP